MNAIMVLNRYDPESNHWHFGGELEGQLFITPKDFSSEGAMSNRECFMMEVAIEALALLRDSADKMPRGDIRKVAIDAFEQLQELC